MLISVEKRFLFVANTKTASTSIEQVLRPYAEIRRGGHPERKHTPLARALEIYDFMFADPAHDPASYFKFGVMRDPIDWITSWFRYRKGNDVEAPLPADMDFADFWARADWNIKRADGSPHLQRDMFCGDDGADGGADDDTVLADVIIPYDRVGDMFAEICTLLGIEHPLQRRNVSRLDDAGAIPKALRAEMRDFYARDYALFERLEQINAAGMARLAARAAAPVSATG